MTDWLLFAAELWHRILWFREFVTMLAFFGMLYAVTLLFMAWRV